MDDMINRLNVKFNAKEHAQQNFMNANRITISENVINIQKN